VAVEKLDIPEIEGNLGDRKCQAEQRKSFVERPDAMEFLRSSGQRLFQQPRLISSTNKRNLPSCGPGRPVEVLAQYSAVAA
jgi:hypothetical protein